MVENEKKIRVKIYPINTKLIAKSGIGKAIKHQNIALELNDIEVVKSGDDFDIAHVNTYSYSSLKFIRRAKKLGKKVIVHAHSTEEDFRNSFAFSNLVSPLFKKWISKVYNEADLLLTPTPYSKKLLKGYGLKPEIIDVSNGVDTAKFEYNIDKKNAFKQKYGFNKDDKIVLSVGLFLRRKGIFDFVELAKEMPEYKFVWCGYVNPKLLPKDTRELLKTKLDNLHFVGYVDDMVGAYSAADIFWMPSYEETEGIVVLEALSMKVPTLLRNIGVYKPWLNDNESVYMASNNSEFKNVIKKVLSGNIDRNILENGRKVAEKRDIKNIGGKLKKIYQELLR